MYIDFRIGNNEKNPEFKIKYMVNIKYKKARISKYNNIFGKVKFKIGQKKFLSLVISYQWS